MFCWCKKILFFCFQRIAQQLWNQCFLSAAERMNFFSWWKNIPKHLLSKKIFSIGNSNIVRWIILVYWKNSFKKKQAVFARTLELFVVSCPIAIIDIFYSFFWEFPLDTIAFALSSAFVLFVSSFCPNAHQKNLFSLKRVFQGFLES